MRIIRVFPRRTSMTPRDDYAFVGDPPLMLPPLFPAADRAGIPVFLKDNLESLLGQNKDYKKFRGYDGEGNMLVSLKQEMLGD